MVKRRQSASPLSAPRRNSLAAGRLFVSAWLRDGVLLPKTAVFRPSRVEGLEREGVPAPSPILAALLRGAIPRCPAKPGPFVSGYPQKVREICGREVIVLLFDEVLCGLRAAPCSIQLRYGVTPNLTAAAKAIGGFADDCRPLLGAPFMDYVNFRIG